MLLCCLAKRVVTHASIAELSPWRIVQYHSTPLVMAVQQGHLPAVKYLTKRGADPNSQNFVGCSCPFRWLGSNGVSD